MIQIIEDFRYFLSNSPTSWHAAVEIGNRLALTDFSPLEEDEKWTLEHGKKYFIKRGGSICAFSVPSGKPKRSVILGSHTDSPALKLKPQPENINQNMTLFGVEVYGGPLLSSWLNRDLGIAGRVIVSDEKGHLEEKLMFIDEEPLMIPQLAIHLDREINEKGLLLNKQDHLFPIACLGEKKEKNYLEVLLRKYLSFHSLISFDLFLVPLEESRFLGCENEMLASYRIDNLASAHASVVALATTKTPPKETLQMGFFWDHEEIGSNTSEGACSPFFSDILQRICASLKMAPEDVFALKKRSLCVSIDMAQGFNPNYGAKYDAQHQPLLGKGIVIKYNANQKYATNAESAAPVIQACRNFNIPYQSYSARNDIPSGSTVGSLFAAATGISTVDIGCPQLSMHSIREVMACADHYSMCKLLTHLLEEK